MHVDILVPFIAQTSYWGNLSGQTRDDILRAATILGVMILLLVLRHVLAKLLIKPLRRLVGKDKTEFDYILFNAADDALRYFILAFILFLVLLSFEFREATRAFLVSVTLTAVAVGFFRFLYVFVGQVTASRALLTNYTGITLNRGLVPVAGIFAQGAVLLVALLTIAQIWRYDVIGILTGLGLGGLAVSLALKEIFDDFLGFIIIVNDDPFGLGDHIKSQHAEGTVERIGLRSTNIRTPDNNLTIVPNSELTNSAITNFSRIEEQWLSFVLGVPHDTAAAKIDALTSRIRDMLKQQNAVKNNSIAIGFTESGGETLDLRVRFYITPEESLKAARDTLESAMRDITAKVGVNASVTSHQAQTPASIAQKPS